MICSELIWNEDGSRYREVIGGLDLTGLRDWEAASLPMRCRGPEMRGGRCGRILIRSLLPSWSPGLLLLPRTGPYTPPVRVLCRLEIRSTSRRSRSGEGPIPVPCRGVPGR